MDSSSSKGAGFLYLPSLSRIFVFAFVFLFFALCIAKYGLKSACQFLTITNQSQIQVFD